MTTNMMVKSVEKSIAFYEGVLGFSVIATTPGKDDTLQFAILAKDNLMLMVQEQSSLIKDYPVLHTDTVKPSINLYFLVDDFEALYKDIKSKHPIHTELHTADCGTEEFAILDADGYVLTFTESVEE